MKTKLLTICLLLFTSQVFAEEIFQPPFSKIVFSTQKQRNVAIQCSEGFNNLENYITEDAYGAKHACSYQSYGILRARGTEGTPRGIIIGNYCNIKCVHMPTGREYLIESNRLHHDYFLEPSIFDRKPNSSFAEQISINRQKLKDAVEYYAFKEKIHGEEWNKNNKKAGKNKKAEKNEIAKKFDPDKLYQVSSGSGFVVSSEGHVITNNHVIENCQKIKVSYKKKDIFAEKITMDKKNDLAIIQANFQPHTVLVLSNDDPKFMQDILVAGYPFGRHISTSVKVTKGIVSALTGLKDNKSNIQIDAALQPGNSGGPIFDNNGNVIGVAVSKLDFVKVVETFGVIPENTNFGVKISIVKNMLMEKNIKFKLSNSKINKDNNIEKSITEGTLYLSCYMSGSQINKFKTKKIMFDNE